MAESYIGEIRMTAFNFAPVGWALCNGDLLSIAQNSALFSLLGTVYGGDGRSTFGLPNLQGRVPVHQGQGVGLSPYTMGDTGGTEQVLLNTSQMPTHIHPVIGGAQAAAVDADQISPVGNIAAQTFDRSGTGEIPSYALPTAATGTLGGSGLQIGPQGGNLPHVNLQPFQVVNFIISLQGIFPSRQ